MEGTSFGNYWLLELLGRGSEHPVQTVERRTLNHRVPHKKAAYATGVW